MKIEIQKLTNTAMVPRYSNVGDAGVDLHADIRNHDGHIDIGPGEYLAIGTGLAMAIPEGYEMQIRPRSGLAYKYGVTVLNAPGTVDSGYRGEVKVILINHDAMPYRVQHRDRIAQGVFKPVTKVEFDLVYELDDSDRGIGGFGSTGK